MKNNESQITSSKIKSQHLERWAYIYVRQSTTRQVIHNRESQEYQYRLSQRAEALGWSTEKTRIIDTDLGISGKSSKGRDGFQELIVKVSLNQVGIIFGYEVSRLARNNTDWYQLLDLCAVFGSLIADADGIYDPQIYNDRLLLGLKGTMSEAELHWIKMRMETGRMNKINRGTYQQLLPTGLLRLPDGSVVKDPNMQVQRVIELIFAKFAEMRSCRQLLKYLIEQQILIPRRHPVGRYDFQLLWKKPTDAMLHSILHNPAYAGAFAYGRRQYESTKRDPKRASTGMLKQPMNRWKHLQKDVYPAYISWEQYMANVAKLKDNSNLFEKLKHNNRGPIRNGEALLQGLAVCGLCGARMSVVYKNKPRYNCEYFYRQSLDRRCGSFLAPPIDDAITQAFFEALSPAQLDVLNSIMQQETTEHQRLNKYWQDQIKRAEYEARLAQRQYDVIDPDNRLVASELERRWEEKLQNLKQFQMQQEQFQKQPPVSRLTAEQCSQFKNLSESLPTLWPNLTMIERKELIRSLVAQVILKRVAPDQIEMKIIWVSGHYTTKIVFHAVIRNASMTSYKDMCQRIRQLWSEGWNNDNKIAAQLTQKGFHSTRSKQVSGNIVKKVRYKLKLYTMLHQSYLRNIDGWITPVSLAKILGVEVNWVRKRLRVGLIDSKFIHRPESYKIWLIKNTAEAIDKFRQLLKKAS